ncbi:hypothetical protein Cantr_07160 [Candida viswanathii]|uniref:Zn(2)-C6 fungal-type domain-containing protein n=1 Tax=Candida viswanathii TaxID=5486 RepID=A0A367XZN0_9ASCO|nr:hypothetical protein Cantr_07160 [Candida viswanathii]
MTSTLANQIPSISTMLSNNNMHPQNNSSQSTIIQLQQQQQPPPEQPPPQGNIPHQQHSMDSLSPSDPPRKRTKVSRACDPCRRKKIKCNAEYLEVEKRVTKICTNCSKNKEICTFQRTPLKRGPSKGYIRDLEEKIIDKHQARHRSDSSGSASTSATIIQTPQQQQQQQPPPPQQQQVQPGMPPTIGIIPPGSIPSRQTLPFPQSSASGSGPSPQNQQPNSTIKLPPIINYPAKTAPSPLISKFHQVDPSNPSSPKSQSNNLPGILNTNGNGGSNPPSATTAGAPPPNSNNDNTNSPPIQGPFWKVPYEMPQSSMSRRSSITSVTSGGAPMIHRRSSVDSVSSISTNGSRLPSIKPSISNDNNYASDADSEDFYSVNSFRGGNISRNSQSLSPRNSISSLSSLNGRLNKSLNFQTNTTGPTSPMVGSPSVQQLPHQQPMSFSPIQVPIYGGNGAPAGPAVAHAAAANTLEHNINIYYTNFHPAFPLLPYDSTLLLSMIHDAKLPPAEWVIEIFHHCLANLVNFKNSGVIATVNLFLRSIQSYPFSTHINDQSLILFLSSLMLLNYTSLINGDQYSQGIAITASIFNDYKVCERFIEHNKKAGNQGIDHIAVYFTKLYYCLNLIDDLNSLSLGTLKNFNNPLIFKFLNDNRDKFLKPDTDSILNNAEAINQVSLLKVEYLVTENLKFDSIRFNKGNTDQFMKYFYELIEEKYDFFKSLIQFAKTYKPGDNVDTFNKELLNKVSQITALILNFANFISGHFHNSSNVIVISPILNLSLVQLFKLIKINKVIIDGVTSTDDQLTKLNNDLSISFNLLNLNLSNLKFGNSIDVLLKNKINHFYKFNFNSFTKSNKSNDAWVSEIYENVMPLISQDITDGWV